MSFRIFRKKRVIIVEFVPIRIKTFQNLPFLSANHHSDILIEDSTIKSVVSQDSFLYQPLSNLDVVTKITVSLNLKLMKKYPIQPRNNNFFYLFNVPERLFNFVNKFSYKLFQAL